MGVLGVAPVTYPPPAGVTIARAEPKGKPQVSPSCRREWRQYPWGSTAPGTTHQSAIYGSYYTANSTGLAPVGTAAMGAGLWGQLDLAGEVPTVRGGDIAPEQLRLPLRANTLSRETAEPLVS